MSGQTDVMPTRAARIAGSMLVLGLPIIVFGHFYLSAGLIVPDDAATTARNIMAHPLRFHLTIVSNVVYAADLLLLLAALYTALKPVDDALALAAAACRLVYAVMWTVIALKMQEATTLLGDANYLNSFEPSRLQTMARLQLREAFDTYYIGLPFFALASAISSYLFLRSGYIPKALAAVGLIASAWCAFCAFGFLASSQFAQIIDLSLFDTPMVLFEVVLGLWLLFKGLQPSGETRPA